MIPTKRRMNDERAIEILKNAKYGILSTSSKKNIPYGVAINYFFDEEDNCLYFHTKKVGKKIENLKNNPLIKYKLKTNYFRTNHLKKINCMIKLLIIKGAS